MEWLANGRYDCMTVDEAYRAHRNNLRFGQDRTFEELQQTFAPPSAGSSARRCPIQKCRPTSIRACSTRTTKMPLSESR